MSTLIGAANTKTTAPRRRYLQGVGAALVATVALVSTAAAQSPVQGPPASAPDNRTSTASSVGATGNCLQGVGQSLDAVATLINRAEQLTDRAQKARAISEAKKKLAEIKARIAACGRVSEQKVSEK